jgi:predicted  nucleic acid-binding Zn-ribbon protein
MAQTDWVVNSNEYQYSMTITAVLSNGNEFSINENDQIGVFDQNGNCVGVSNPSVYYEPLEANLVFMVIYSNSVNNSYNVRAYFDEVGTEVEFLDIVFIANSTQGSIANPYVFHENGTIFIEGCTDPDSDNYNPEAMNDDGSCLKTVLGCMNQDAPNYDPEANTSDNSCSTWQEAYLLTLDSLNISNDNLSSIQSDLSFTQSELTSIQYALSSTELDLASANTTIVGLNTDLDASNSSISNLETSLSITQSDLVSTLSDLAETQSELSNTESVLATSQSDLSETQSELIITQDSLSSAKLDLMSANASITGLNTDLSIANSSISNLEDQIIILQNNQEDGIGQEDVDAAFNIGYLDGETSVDITSDNQEAYAEGVASITPDDGISQDDLDAIQILLEEALANSGGPCEPIYIDIVQGWNIVGYTIPFGQDVAATVSDIVDSIELIKNNAAQVYWPEYGFNGIGDFVPGEGYQMKTTAEILDYTWPDVNGQTPSQIVKKFLILTRHFSSTPPQISFTTSTFCV